MSNMIPDKPWTLLETSIRFLPAHMQPPIREHIAEQESRLSAVRLINLELQEDSDKMLEALKHNVHLHLCDLEGIHQPTPEQWMDGLEMMNEAIAKAEGK